MGRIGTGWQLTKTSLRVLRKDKELLLFPLLSGLAILGILAAFIGGMFVTVGFGAAFGGDLTWLFAVLMVVYYIVSFFIAFFSLNDRSLYSGLYAVRVMFPRRWSHSS